MDDHTPKRRGAEALEFAVSLPLLLAILAGIVDFGWFATHQSAVHAAASTGARAGSMTPLDQDPVGAATLTTERALENARLDGATVTVGLLNLSNGERAIRVTIDAPYSGLWGMLPLPVDYQGLAVLRMDEQPLAP